MNSIETRAVSVKINAVLFIMNILIHINNTYIINYLIIMIIIIIMKIKEQSSFFLYFNEILLLNLDQ